MAKIKTIKLGHTKGDHVENFSFEHALNILRIEEKSGRHDWKIVDKNFEYKEHEIIRSPRNTEKPEESTPNREGQEIRE